MSAHPTYLAFDLGASSGRAVLGTLVDGEMRTEVIHRFETPTLEEEGHLFWDVEELWVEMRRGFARALEVAPGLRSLSVDSWAVDYVPLDGNGVPLRRPYRYRDLRTNEMMERAFETLSAEAIYAHTGIQFLQFNTLFQLLADQEEDLAAVGAVHHYLPMADFFNFRFSGRSVVEVSMASTTQLMDVRTREWSIPLFRAFGLDPARWPAIVPSGTVLGPAREAAEVAVIASCSHDTGSAVAAAPVTSEKPWAFISSGTWSLLGAEITEPLLTSEARKAGFTHEAGVDGSIRFLKNLTGLWALQECAREWGEADWEALEREAGEAPAGTALIDLEDPRFLAPGDMPRRLRDFCRERGLPVPETRGTLVRVVLESVAASYGRALKELEGVTGCQAQLLHLFGGGSRNRLLCQFAANACSRTVVAGPAEATALGNLLLQARTLGDLPEGLSLREVAAHSSDLELFQPTLQSP